MSMGLDDAMDTLRRRMVQLEADAGCSADRVALLREAEAIAKVMDAAENPQDYDYGC